MKNLLIKKNIFKNFFDFIARVAISSIFVSAIPGKITNFAKTVDYISLNGIPDPIASVLLVGAIVCLTLGSGFFIFGGNQKIGASFLLLFLIPTTIIFHVFPFHQKAVLTNLGLIGGLFIAALRDQR